MVKLYLDKKNPITSLSYKVGIKLGTEVKEVIKMRTRSIGFLEIRIRITKTFDVYPSGFLPCYIIQLT